jgi:Flp pilus assembly protein TadG
MKIKITATSRGQAVVEMALVLPIFIFVIVGIFDFGRALHSWSTLNFQCTKAARIASKRLSPLIARNLYTAETHTPLGQEADVYGVYDEFWRYRSPTMAEADYDVTFTGVGTDTQEVTISATYELSLITPFMGALVGGSNGNGKLVIAASATVMKE